MKRDYDYIPPEEELRSRWPIITARIVSGLIFLGGLLVSVRLFSGNELIVAIILMLFPMAMIWYPREIDDLGKGGYGEGGEPPYIIAGFGWVCLFAFLVIIGLRVKGYL